MYPSGTWRGFWQQEHFGRQPMVEFQLEFRAGEVIGRGADVVGIFTVHGSYNPATGTVDLRKQYVGKHAVQYRGEPDGEGSILGTWKIGGDKGGTSLTGPFLMQPVRDRPPADLPIRDL